MYHPDPHSSRDDWYYQGSWPNFHIYHSHPSFPPVPSATQHRTDVPTAYYDGPPGHYYRCVHDSPQPRGSRGLSGRSHHTNSFPGQAAASTQLGTQRFDAAWISQRLNRLSVAPKIVQPTPVSPGPVPQFLNGLSGAHEYPPVYTKPAQHRSRRHRSASTHGDRNAFGLRRTYESFESLPTPTYGRSSPVRNQHPPSPRRVSSYDTWTSSTTLNDVPSVHSSLPKKSADRHQGSGRQSNNLVSERAAEANQNWALICRRLKTEPQRYFQAECMMDWDFQSLTLTLPLTTQISIRITKKLSPHDLKDPLTVMMGLPAAGCAEDEGEIQAFPNVLKSRVTGKDWFEATSVIIPSPNNPCGWELRPEIKWPMRTAEEFEAEGYATEGFKSMLLANGGMASLGLASDVDLWLLLSQPQTEVCFTEKLESELDAGKSRYPARTFDKSGRRRDV